MRIRFVGEAHFHLKDRGAARAEFHFFSFLRAKKLWVNPPKAERAKPSLSSDYNLLFKNKIGESSLDIHHMGSFWNS